jgi:L-ascorbate metabolism protein UlaG (beta-lactamase superfamily)
MSATMIEPVKTGAKLIQEIEREQAPVPILWWLGQSGFAIKYAGTLILIDPYLSESLTAKYANTGRPHIRMTAAPFRAGGISFVDLVLCTHKHSDHLDPGTVPQMLEASAGAGVAVPKPLVDHTRAMGIPDNRIVSAFDGWTIRVGSMVVSAIPSAHETLDATAEGHPYLGYIIRAGNEVIYHSGDCVPYEGLGSRLRAAGVTTALLPINGRDPERGVPGNFSIEEAAALSAEAGARWLVPMHYDMFTFNTVDVSRFESYMRDHCPGRLFKVLQCGERWSPAGVSLAGEL